MAKIYNEPIDPNSNIDWGVGDESTGNKPLSGAVVQKFIKDNINLLKNRAHALEENVNGVPADPERETPAVPGLLDRVESIENTVNGDGEGNDGLSDRMTAVEATVNGTEGADGLSDRMSAVEATVNGTEGADGLSDRMSAAEGRLNDIDGQEGALADLDERMDQAEEDINNLQEDVSGLQDTTSEMQETLSNIDPAAIEAALEAFDPETLDERFQEVHDKLDGKAGYFYLDTSAQQVLVFASQESYEAWDEMPEPKDDSLILGRFSAPSDFEGVVTITGVDPAIGVKYIQYGDKGERVQATFQVYRKNGNVLSPEPAVATIIIKNEQGVVLLETQQNISTDGIINLNVDDYLVEGRNIVTVRAKGNNTGTVGSASYTIVALQLTLSDTFEINKIVEEGGQLSVTWTAEGAGEKFVKWYIDGSDTLPDGTEISEDSDSANPGFGTKRIPISSLTPGKHTLQYYAYLKVGTTGRFYSNLLYRDFVIDTNNIDSSSLSNNYIAILNAFTAPVNTSVVPPAPMILPGTGTSQDPIIFGGLTQYEAADMYYCLYYKDLDSSKDVSITLNTTTSLHSASNLGRVTRYELKSYDDGLIPLIFECGSSSVYFNLNVARTSYDIKNIDDNLAFNFSGGDKDNSSGHPELWEYTNSAGITYRGDLSNFEWISSSGWNDGRLIFSDGASFVTNYQPFHRGVGQSPIKTTGLTFEIEFKTSRVLNEQTTILDLRDSNQRGLLITTSEIIYTSGTAQKELSTKYKPEENIRVSIVINPLSGTLHHNLLMMYVDGVLTSMINYPDTDTFDSEAVFAITGTSNATVELKQVRCYEKVLGPNDIFNNYMLYRDTAEELLEVYDRNDIYTNSDKTAISMDKLAGRTPVIIITGKDPGDPVTQSSPDPYETLIHFTTQDKGTYVRMYSLQVINRDDPSRNLYLEDLSMRCQGTSSMEYPIKNFRFYTQNDYGSGKASKYDSKPWNPKPGAGDSGKQYYTKMWVGGPEDDPKAGTELSDKKRKYSFKAGAQPVKTWCLKADYAESSSTHNTGIARLWNDAMKSFSLQRNEIDPRYYLDFPGTDNRVYPGQTIAQRQALKYEYPYDVRTTVDGFPITLFYHTHENEPLKFIGRYNWNNDKSTESVYGFCDIPGFDTDPETGEKYPEGVGYGGTMECWEVKEGDMDVNTFSNLDRWENGQNSSRDDKTVSKSGSWKESFEARYPDDGDDDSEITRARKEVTHIDETTGELVVDDPGGALWRVCKWIHSTKGASRVEGNKMVMNLPDLWQKFVNEKWQYLDVYKMAAYYCYLMRFGAVDQVVKNAMFTTEDGLHWFYINYDNDTINGVRNDGALKFGYDIDRQSVDASNGKYCYAGHESVLWNNLESDTEFMEIVRKVDNALYESNVLTYQHVIDMFNNQQSGQWAERTHNEDYTYKYLTPWIGGLGYSGGDDTQFAKLQGPRKSHRQWWLSNRFSRMDALNGVGSYMDSYITMKPNGNLKMRVGDRVTISSSNPDQIFAWSVGNAMKESGRKGEVGEDITFNFPTTDFWNIGAELKFYNAVFMTKFDLSAVSDMVNEIRFNWIDENSAYDSTLTEIIFGTPQSAVNNQTSLPGLNTISYVKYLEKFIMNNYKGLTNIDLSHNKYLKYVDLRYCDNLTNIALPEEAPIDHLYYPGNVENITLNGLTKLEDFGLDSYATVKNISITGCPLLDTKYIVFRWLSQKTALDSACSLTLDNVNWTAVTNVEINRLITFYKNGGTISLNGHIRLSTTITSYELAHDLEIMFGGTNVWKSTSSFYIDVEPTLILRGVDSILEGEYSQYSVYYIGSELNTPSGALNFEIETKPADIRVGTRINELIDGTPAPGVLSTTENGYPSKSVRIRAYQGYRMTDGTIKVIDGEKDVNIVRRVYPADDFSNVSITGNHNMIPGTTSSPGINPFSLQFSGSPAVTGAMTATWEVTGALSSWVNIEPQGTDGMDGCILKMTDTPHGTPASDYLVVNGTIQVTLRYKYGTTGHPAGSLVGNEGIKSLTIGYKDPQIAMTAATNPLAMTVVAQVRDKVPDATYLTSEQAGSINTTDLQPGQTAATSLFFQNTNFRNQCKNFDEFESFTGLRDIPANLFYGCVALESIVIPNSVEIIRTNAFAGCSSLKRIVIPRNVVTIESGAFSGCSSLETVIFAEGNEITSLGTSVFANCSKLNNFTIPNTLTSIPSSTFSGCTSLTHITIPDSITTPEGTSNDSIGSYAFSGCNKLRSVDFGTGVKRIGSYAFSGSGLYTLNIPDNVVYISSYAFQGCNSLKTANLGDGLTSAGSCLFVGCSELETLNIGNGLTAIPSEMCSRCAKLKNLHIGSGVTQIYTYGSTNRFGNGYAVGLATVGYTNIPQWGQISASNGYSSYTYYFPFYGCVNLENITIDPNNTRFSDGRDGNGENCIIYKSDSVNKLLITACKTTVIPNNCTMICTGSYANMTGITTVNIPNNVRTIAELSFCDCADLTTVTFAPDSGLQSIGRCAFANCSKLTKIELPELVSGVGDAAFAACTQLGEVDLGRIGSIGQYSFINCINIAELDLPDTVTSIGQCAFYGCEYLINFNITSNSRLTTVPYRTFCNCKSLESIYIPNTVTSIASESFRGCLSLHNIHIGSGVRSIDPTAFRSTSATEYLDIDSITIDIDNEVYSDGTLNNGGNCIVALQQNPKNIILGCKNTIIPNNAEGIGDYAFAYCPGLSVLDFPSNITSIGNNSYQGTGITKLKINNLISGIGQSAFRDCTNLYSVDIGLNMYSIGTEAFRNCTNLRDVVARPEFPPMLGSSAFASTNLVHIYVANLDRRNAYVGNSSWNQYQSLIIYPIPSEYNS